MNKYTKILLLTFTSLIVTTTAIADEAIAPEATAAAEAQQAALEGQYQAGYYYQQWFGLNVVMLQEITAFAMVQSEAEV